MCGRYTIRRYDLLVAGLRAMPGPDFEEFSEHVNPKGLFNIAPSQMCPIVRLNREGKRTISLAKWGLIPSWTKGKPKQQPINAKCETAATSGMFRQAMQRRRCLVPADGFYEWQGQKPPKQPYFIHMKNDELFAFAGLWERWKASEEADPIDTFTIITTEPNDVMRPIHNRMPVILDQSAFDRWLDRDLSADQVGALVVPYDPKNMEAWKVSTQVNKPTNDEPSLVDHVDPD